MQVKGEVAGSSASFDPEDLVLLLPLTVENSINFWRPNHFIICGAAIFTRITRHSTIQVCLLDLVGRVCDVSPVLSDELCV